MNKFGLPQRAMDEMHAIFAKHGKVKKVVLYGSRAMGNYKNGSDIDLTMYGSALTFDDLNNIAGELEESSIPYLVDLSIFDVLDHAKLKDHIKRHGRVFYDRYAGWKTVKLGDVCSFTRGLTYSKKDEEEISNIAVLRATNIDLSTHTLLLDEIRYISENVKVKEDKFSKLDDILICTASGSKKHLGKVALITENANMAFGGFMGALRTKDSCLAAFLFKILISDKFKYHLNSISEGANINNLRFSQIENFEFSLPPLAEQQRIVAKLDAAFAEIDTAIEATEKQAIQATMFGYRAISNVLDELANKFPNKSLDEAVTIQPKKKLALEKLSENDEVSFMGMNKLGIEQKYSEASEAMPLKEVYKSYQYFEENDVVFAKITPCFENGKLGVVRNLTNGIGFGSSEFVVLRPKSESRSGFVYYCLLNEVFRKNGADNMSGAVGHKRVTKKYYFNYPITVPPLDVQDECVKRFDEIWTQTTTIEQLKHKKADELTSLKSAILAQELQRETA